MTKPISQPPTKGNATSDAFNRKRELMERKEAMRDALSLLIGSDQKGVVEQFLKTTETEDIEKEYRGLLAAAKTLATLDEDFRQGLELCRRVISDMAKNLNVNQGRTEQVKARLTAIVNLVKNWDNIEDKEGKIAELEKAIENLG